uniref:cystatin-like n=1 Tax=Euleptes europaea TaxID=460621 RepID=UPI002541A633|nr:cystatin-like [Euleptes europaea]
MVATFALLLLPLLAEAVAPQTEQLAGGLVDEDVSDPEIQDVARFATQAYNQADDGLFYIRDVKLIRAQSQVVAGIKYVLTLEMALTKCLKNLPSNDLEKCQIPPDAKRLVELH